VNETARTSRARSHVREPAAADRLAGTTAGMLALFVSLHRANASLELGALAIALLSACSR
jgi:hypothetical protein